MDEAGRFARNIAKLPTGGSHSADLQLPDFSNSKQSVPPTQARLGPCSRERHGTD